MKRKLNIILLLLVLSTVMIACNDNAIETNDDKYIAEIEVLELKLKELENSNSKYSEDNELLVSLTKMLNVENDNLKLELSQVKDSDEGLDSGLIIDNPIDQFFLDHPNYGQSKSSSIEYSTLFSDTWKNEMNYAFDILLANTNALYVEDVKRLKELYLEIAELDSEIHLLAFDSNAFQEIPENEDISYGFDYYHFLLEIQASKYQSYTKTIHNYLDFSEIEYEYGFKPESILDEMEKFNK